MSLPSSRNTTYVPDQQVKSFDLNNIQDELIIARAPETRMITPEVAQPVTAAGWFKSTTGKSRMDVGANTEAVLHLPIPLAKNERIRSLKLVYQGNGALDDLVHGGGSTGCLWKTECQSGDSDVTSAVVAGTAISCAAVATIQEDFFDFTSAPLLVDSNEHYFVSIKEGNTAGSKFFYRAEVVVDRLVV